MENQPNLQNQDQPTRAVRSVAKPRLAFGTPGSFRNDVTLLLHSRLRTGTLVIGSVLLVGYFPVLFYDGLLVRTVALVGVGLAYLLLRGGLALSYRQLRGLELGMWACLLGQMLYMPDVLILEAARADEVATAVMERYFNTGVWAVLVVSYGVMIPSTWQRALLTLGTLGCLPDLNFYLLSLYEPAVWRAFHATTHALPFPLMLPAVAAGVSGAYMMNSARKEAFDARQMGQYRLKEKLGAGGMGEVYRAEHKLLKRPCAIKLIRPDVDTTPAVLGRFEREVQATAQLSHWNTIEIYDYGRTDEGVFYYVMELLPGMSLAELIERFGPLPPARVVYLLRQICAGLGEAHRQGLIHRDIKPGNIFVSRRGGTYDVVKLLDFGLVKDTRDRTLDAQITQVGVVSGTPAYMSPEQASAAVVDPRADLYSVGGVAYHMLVGDPPFAGDSPFAIMMANARDPVVPPSVRNPLVPDDLSQAVVRCLEKRREDRFPDAAALERALAACGCAGEWSGEKAATWWAANAPAALGDEIRPQDVPTVEVGAARESRGVRP